MKTLIGLFILITSITSVSHANTVRIGNGGDTQADSSVSENAITAAIFKTATDAQLLIHSWMKNSMAGSILSEKERQDLLVVIRATPVDVIGYDACSDGTNKKDAVAYTNPSNRICISTLQLKGKLNSANYRNQILALMMHEYSHLIGFNEDRAEKLQQSTLMYMDFTSYPTNFQGIAIDDFTLYNPYSIFAGRWKNKQLLSEEVKSYTTELREKMTDYAANINGIYPLIPADKNLTGDVLIRLNYLDVINKAYWTTPANRELRKRLILMEQGGGGMDLVFFNNSEINPAILGFTKGDLAAPGLTDQKEESFRALILQIDSLKKEMEDYIWSVLRPTAKFTYYPAPLTK